MMGGLIRSLLAILIATVLIGAPAVQAAITMPCQTIVASTPDYQMSSGQAPAPTPTPCKGVMPGCADMLSCNLGAGLPAHVTAVAYKLIWTSVAYRTLADALEGLTVEPDLGPPITI